MRSSLKYLFFISIMIFALHLQSCVDLLSDSDSDKDEPSIVFGDDIEGVKIWDDSLTVVNKLGRPTSIALGDFWGYWFEYKTGKYNHTLITISTTPLLGNGVINMSVEAPYQGKSKEGIGIGSERSFVINKLGAPESTDGESPNQIDRYKYEKNFFLIQYENSIVKKITMLVYVN